MSFSNKRLIKRLKLRDTKAFEQLIEEYQKNIYNLVYRMLGNRTEAEDLLQEIFISVFKKIDTFREEASLSTWIYKIATNHCINRRKYLGKREQVTFLGVDDFEQKKQIDGSSNICASMPRPDELVEGYETQRLIQEAILDLEPEYRVVLVLRDVQNLSYEEIEEIVGINSGTVKSRLHRARMTLKESLASHLR